MEPININLKSTKIQDVAEEEIIYENNKINLYKENMQEPIKQDIHQSSLQEPIRNIPYQSIINLNNESCLYKWVFVIIMSFTVALGLNSLFMFLIKRLIIQNKMTSFGSISIRTIYPIGILIFLLFVVKLNIIQ